MATLIYDVSDLQDMNLDLAGNYELANNIDASATSGWNGGAGFDPIGDSGTKFTGTFNGKDFSIDGLFINRPAESYVGLFGYANGATIQNVSLTNLDITGNSNVGGLIGYSPSCIVRSCSSTGNVEGAASTGGVIGTSYNLTIDMSYSTALIVCSGDYAGGLIGYSSWDAEISRSYATGNVNGVNEVGGLIGYADNANEIYECYALGNVVGTGDYVGGLIGDSWTNPTCRCFATGDVQGVNQVGGLIGIARFGSDIDDCYARGASTGTDDIGGLIGQIRASTLDNAYSTGIPTGGTDEGGLIGLNYAGGSTITDCFWDTQASGQSTSDGGTGKTTAQMKTMATFPWDIIRTSEADPTNGYPFLSWQAGLAGTWAIAESEPESPRRTSEEPIEDKVTLQLIREMEMSGQGRFYVDESGNATYKSRFARSA